MAFLALLYVQVVVQFYSSSGVVRRPVCSLRRVANKRVYSPTAGFTDGSAGGEHTGSACWRKTTARLPDAHLMNWPFHSPTYLGKNANTTSPQSAPLSAVARERGRPGGLLHLPDRQGSLVSIGVSRGAPLSSARAGQADLMTFLPCHDHPLDVVAFPSVSLPDRGPTGGYDGPVGN
jgi:hypothetical protein